jgi:hypothetical protein
MENKIIENKIKEKTAGDPIMEKFITDIVELEIHNKQYSAPYKEKIKKSVKERNK